MLMGGGSAVHFLVISDTHGQAEKIRYVLSCQNTLPEALFFLGDGLRDLADAVPERMQTVAVRGNCDWSSAFADVPTERLVAFAGFRFLLMHGHEHGVKYGPEAAMKYAALRGADVLLFGHTHLRAEMVLPAGSKLEELVLQRPLYVFNPGSLGYDNSFGTVTVHGGELLFGFGEI